MTNETPQPQTGRNEPCPCGSGKKYKRCHGVDAAPKLTTPALPAAAPEGAGASGLPFDPSQMDPAMMMQMSQALQRLPRGQLQRLQAIMQKAMAGKDVTREAAEFERSLPPDFKNLMSGFAQGAMGGTAPAAESNDMSADEARKIVEKAAAEGKISAEQAKELLAAQNGSTAETHKESKFGRLFGRKSK